MNSGDHHINWMLAKTRMDKLKIHASETAWVGTKFDYVFENDGTIDELFNQVRNLVVDPLDASERPLYVGLVDNLHTQS